MNAHRIRRTIALLAGLCLCAFTASAQDAASRQSTPLPDVNVTSSPYTEQHGGYLISGNFRVDPRMPFVVFPARALVKDDILSVQPLRLNEDEYLVLQECASADCSQAHVVRVWNTYGAATPVHNSDDRIWIRHENKYFIWLGKLPTVLTPDCPGCGTVFSNFEPLSPPMTLVPAGEMAAYHRAELDNRDVTHPVPVREQKHDGPIFVVTFADGSVVRIKRMHSVR